MLPKNRGGLHKCYSKSINFPWILFEYLLSVNGDDHALFLPLLDVGNLATRRFEQG